MAARTNLLRELACKIPVLLCHDRVSNSMEVETLRTLENID
jgi:hypothetical protein